GASGKPKGILDGACLTAIRTGAASGVATDLLASPDSKILCMIGSGAQAPDQIDAVCSVRDIQEIRIFSRNLETAEVLARSVANSRPNVKVEVADSVRAALADADVVCCATTSVRPLVFLDDLKSNVHINAIGAHTHSMCELDTQVLVKSRILLVDSIEAAMREAGDIVRALEAGLISQDHVSELGQFLINPGDTPSSGLTVFKSVGIAAQDWAIASFAIARVLSESQFQFDHLSPAPNGI
ncbi:MAG TPA: hypothetical protein VKR27_00820, partial [Acidimicrobiales bacterium]|nr:hypothetical protein [Acidimicrobiales bacterium]